MQRLPCRGAVRPCGRGRYECGGGCRCRQHTMRPHVPHVVRLLRVVVVGEADVERLFQLPRPQLAAMADLQTASSRGEGVQRCAGVSKVCRSEFGCDSASVCAGARVGACCIDGGHVSAMRRHGWPAHKSARAHLGVVRARHHGAHEFQHLSSRTATGRGHEGRGRATARSAGAATRSKCELRHACERSSSATLICSTPARREGQPPRGSHQ